MSDDEKEDGPAIYRVETIPPPDGEDDAYSAPTKVGPMADAAVRELMQAAERRAAELSRRRRRRPPRLQKSRPRFPRRCPSSQPGSLRPPRPPSRPRPRLHHRPRHPRARARARARPPRRPLRPHRDRPPPARSAVGLLLRRSVRWADRCRRRRRRRPRRRRWPPAPPRSLAWMPLPCPRRPRSR